MQFLKCSVFQHTEMVPISVAITSVIVVLKRARTSGTGLVTFHKANIFDGFSIVQMSHCRAFNTVKSRASPTIYKNIGISSLTPSVFVLLENVTV